jgi:hypothetical protein
MMILKRLLFVVFCFSSIAMADREIDEKDFSGWMQGYDSLVYNEKRNAYLFFNEARRGKYQRVLLDSVTVYSADAETNGAIALEASAYLTEGFNELLARKMIVAEEAGPGVLVLRIAITGVEKSKEDLKAYNFIPVGAVFRGAQAATGNVSTYIDTMFEGEMTDSQSGERLGAIVAKGIMETEKRSGDELTFSDVKPTLDKWLKQYEQTLDEYLAAQSDQ